MKKLWALIICDKEWRIKLASRSPDNDISHSCFPFHSDLWQEADTQLGIFPGPLHPGLMMWLGVEWSLVFSPASHSSWQAFSRGLTNPQGRWSQGVYESRASRFQPRKKLPADKERLH